MHCVKSTHCNFFIGVSLCFLRRYLDLKMTLAVVTNTKYAIVNRQLECLNREDTRRKNKKFEWELTIFADQRIVFFSCKCVLNALNALKLDESGIYHVRSHTALRLLILYHFALSPLSRQLRCVVHRYYFNADIYIA